MEGCGLVLATPFTLVTSLVFCLFVHFAFRRWPKVRRICTMVALVVVAALAIEIVLSLCVGPFHLHERFGRAYGSLHLVDLLFGPPAVGVLGYVAVSRFVGFFLLRVGLATVVCWFACMAILLANIMVDEDIEGVDGSGRRPTTSIFPP